MILTITIDVKFRAFGIDFGKAHQEYHYAVPEEAAVLASAIERGLTFSQRGVTVSAKLN